MLSFAVGIGAAAFLELQVVHRFRHRVDFEGLRLLLSGHNLIKLALYGLWATGLGLLFIRVGVQGNPLNAKLVAKLAVVILLTLNTRLIDRVLIPELFEYEGERLPAIPPMQRVQFGAIGGFSAGCWMSALLLGAFSAMKAMGPVELAGILLPIVLSAAAFGACVGLAAGYRQQTPARDPWAVPGE